MLAGTWALVGLPKTAVSYRKPRGFRTSYGGGIRQATTERWRKAQDKRPSRMHGTSPGMPCHARQAPCFATDAAISSQTPRTRGLLLCCMLNSPTALNIYHGLMAFSVAVSRT